MRWTMFDKSLCGGDPEKQAEYWYSVAMHCIGTDNELRRARAAWKEDRERLEQLKAENAELRKLAQILIHCLSDVDGCDTCAVNGNPYDVRGEWAACDELLDRIRELRLEVVE